MSTGVIVLIVVAVVLVLGVIFIYNNLVSLRNNRENAFANIDVQLKQRHDLIPQLVAAVKGYAEHEKGLLERITQARTAAMNATTINDKIEAENALSSALAGLKVSVEAYPDLKANQNFLQLQGEISDIENKLAATRRFFNSATKELNTAVPDLTGLHDIYTPQMPPHTKPVPICHVSDRIGQPSIPCDPAKICAIVLSETPDAGGPGTALYVLAGIALLTVSTGAFLAGSRRRKED